MPARSQSKRTKSIKKKGRLIMNDHSAHTDHEHSSGHGGSSDNDHKEPPRQYFLPGKILVHLEHPAGIDPRDLARLINGHLLDPVGEVGEVRGLGLADHV